MDEIVQQATDGAGRLRGDELAPRAFPQKIVSAPKTWGAKNEIQRGQQTISRERGDDQRRAGRLPDGEQPQGRGGRGAAGGARRTTHPMGDDGGTPSSRRGDPGTPENDRRARRTPAGRDGAVDRRRRRGGPDAAGGIGEPPQMNSDCGEVRRSARRSHKPDQAGSTPAPAINRASVAGVSSLPRSTRTNADGFCPREALADRPCTRRLPGLPPPGTASMFRTRRTPA